MTSCDPQKNTFENGKWQLGLRFVWKEFKKKVKWILVCRGRFSLKEEKKMESYSWESVCECVCVCVCVRVCVFVCVKHLLVVAKWAMNGCHGILHRRPITNNNSTLSPYLLLSLSLTHTHTHRNTQSLLHRKRRTQQNMHVLGYCLKRKWRKFSFFVPMKKNMIKW